MGINVQTIGRTGSISKRLKDYYRIDISTLTSDTLSMEIISAITFGDPAVIVSSNAVYDVLFSWDGLYKAGFASSENPTAVVQRGFGSAAPTNVDSGVYEGGSNDCEVITPIILQGNRVENVGAAVADRRYKVRWDTEFGTGALICDRVFNATILLKLSAGEVLSTPGRADDITITVTKVE